MGFGSALENGFAHGGPSKAPRPNPSTRHNASRGMSLPAQVPYQPAAPPVGPAPYQSHQAPIAYQTMPSGSQIVYVPWGIRPEAPTAGAYPYLQSAPAVPPSGFTLNGQASRPGLDMYGRRGSYEAPPRYAPFVRERTPSPVPASAIPCPGTPVMTSIPLKSEEDLNAEKSSTSTVPHAVNKARGSSWRQDEASGSDDDSDIETSSSASSENDDENDDPTCAGLCLSLGFRTIPLPTPPRSPGMYLGQDTNQAQGPLPRTKSSLGYQPAPMPLPSRQRRVRFL